MHAVKCCKPIGPFLRNAYTIDAVYLIAGSAGVICAHFEPRREDDAVHGVLLAVENNPALGDFIHPTAIGVYQGYIGPIKCR